MKLAPEFLADPTASRPTLYRGPAVPLAGLQPDFAYTYLTAPYAHQHAAFELSATARYFALFMEQGTGKTKVLLDTAAALYEADHIDLLLVVTDNGLHRAWVEEGVPDHLPPRVEAQCLVWDSKRHQTKRAAAERIQWTTSIGLKVLAVNVEALLVPVLQRWLHELLRAHRTLLVLDESTSIKSPSTKRTKVMWALSPLAKYVRIATGIPAPESPLNFYAQGRFLSPNFWDEGSYFTFKHTYALWEPRTNGATGRRFEVQKLGPNKRPVYQNLKRLMAQVAPHSYRVMKDECLDLPPKIFQRIPFALSAEQQRLYLGVMDGWMDTVLPHPEGSSAYQAAVQQAIVRMVRAQQITSGFVVAPRALLVDDGEDGEGAATVNG